MEGSNAQSRAERTREEPWLQKNLLAMASNLVAMVSNPRAISLQTTWSGGVLKLPWLEESPRSPPEKTLFGFVLHMTVGFEAILQVY